ncbi:MAG: complex I NDUFA9 subunit family protein [Thiohalocapsa sp.]|jgi:NADH dehydrogenase|uniref:complex I NDUFA9 subunit family protein n=1 Tax=Thiohalocapsa sp. TaxID=2497641 RepID=UPI0025F19D79|nr:complex I NDUFA9 subunit family protein [Thiohalocapsa sp.]MCG6943120.1 complex I NDUFA9 subunit family protein [Thiohalocapsa sp.]
MKRQRACIIGGTGFVGRHLLTRLRAAGYHCIVPTRRMFRHRDLKLYPDVELCELSPTVGLEELFADCDLVVNLAGILNESDGMTFEAAHVELVRRIVAAAEAAGVPRLLHMSALHADAARGGSAYLRSKGQGEDIAQAASMAVTSFRPSVIFGRGDSFFNRFAGLLNMAPGVVPLACPQARFAPVWVDDVAQAMVRSIHDERTVGRRYDLCGPRVLTLKELMRYTAARLGKRVWIIGLNDTASRLMAKLFGMLPGAPITLDNYLSMQTPSVCEEHNALLQLGIHPTDIDTVVPTYLP